MDNPKKKKKDAQYLSQQKHEKAYEKKRKKTYKKYNKVTKKYDTITPGD